MTHPGTKLCSCSYYTIKMPDFHCRTIEAVYMMKLQNAQNLHLHWKAKEEWKLLTISVVTGKYKGFPLDTEETNKKLVICFASIFLKYCIYTRFPTSLWAPCKAWSDFSGVLFSKMIRWNDPDKFTPVRNYVFSL